MSPPIALFVVNVIIVTFDSSALVAPFARGRGRGEVARTRGSSQGGGGRRGCWRRVRRGSSDGCCRRRRRRRGGGGGGGGGSFGSDIALIPSNYFVVNFSSINSLFYEARCAHLGRCTRREREKVAAFVRQVPHPITLSASPLNLFAS